MTASKFEFPDIDEIGIDTLDAISFAPGFNKYMYETIEPFCKGHILEIGAGIGNISEHFVNKGAEISLTDIRDNYVEILESNFKESAKEIFNLDIVSPDFDTKFKSHFESYDSIFALNVVEHIEDHELAIRNIKKLLRPNGHIIILVPAYQVLYNSFDKALEHFRRYTQTSLTQIIKPEFEIIHRQYFNVFGIAGWIVSGGILKKKTIPRNQMELYDKLIGLSRFLDKLVLNKIGLSVITVGKK